MARLIVKLHGEEVTTVPLERGQEYIAGRAQDAQIQLGKQRGISRHHLKFYEREGVWVCESLSKFGMLQKGDQSVEILELTETMTFVVPPYEFTFETAEAAPREKEAAKRDSSDNLPAFFQPRTGPPVSGSDATAPARASSSDATSAGVPANLVPYFRISYPNTADDEVLKLEGHLWVAGRDHTCEIPIESPHVSRKHFELARMKEGFFITDLGSSNGTKLNGQRIPPHEPKRLESGDEIQIKNVEMTFEIRDTNFNHRVESLPVPAFDPMLAAPPMPWYPPVYQEGANLPALLTGEFPKDWKKIRMHHIKAMGPRKLIVRGLLVFFALLFLIVAMLPDKPKPNPGGDKGANSVSFEKLTNEQRAVVKDSFNLARNLYVQGKYELCLTELAKLHELIPQYENSKELQSFCEQGKELVQKQRDLERKERERQQIEQQIAGYVEMCKNKLKDVGTVDETRTCLAEAMELDPEHHLIIEMINTAQMHEEEQKFNAKQKAEIERKHQAGIAHFKRAHELYKTGHLYKAKNEYNRFLKIPYPQTEDTKESARRDLASVEKELKTKVESLLDQCRSLGGKGHFKDGYIACDKAVEEDPDNDAAKSERGHMMNELKKELKAVYEDSTLEESLGNVDSAKEKWKRILKDDLENGEYYKKARSKLQKYGMEP
jgi:pSer/pThr/pTyr-binding forkhead associated (FHA) protein/tetratricopeptide (TPR) repeat protein